MFDQPSGQFNRRHFLIGGAALAGSLVVGWALMPPRQRLESSALPRMRKGDVKLNGWVMIGTDNRVTVVLAKNEMGQGIMTALPTLVAEEMDVPLTSLRLVQAPLDKIYGDTTMLAEGLPFHPEDHSAIHHLGRWLSRKIERELGIQVTGGSSSVKDSWLPMREAGASARARLMLAAANRWGVPVSECNTIDGHVTHARGLKASYGELAADAAELGDVSFQLKEASAFNQIGKSLPRLDIPAKIDGSADFGMDIKPKGMVYAALLMCPHLGGRLISVDTRVANELPGVLKVVRLNQDRSGAPDAVAVIAGSRWTAQSALELLTPVWQPGPHSQLTNQVMMQQLRQSLSEESGFTYYSVGDEIDDDQLPKAIKAEYSAPYLAHTPMEPINCTAQLIDGRLKIWVPTQAPSIVVATAARLADLSADQIDLTETFLGGGFGRRLETDMVAQAVALAMEMPGIPVQLLWQREDDIAHDFYRPACVAQMLAVLGEKGKIKTWQSKSVSAAPIQQLLKRAFDLPPFGPDKTAAEGLFDHHYEIENQRVAHVIVESPLPVGPWRSVGHSHHAFFKESFVDELAHAANVDPAEFRRHMLVAHPRHLAVLNAAVERAGKPAQARAHGLALHACFGSIVAQVAEVSIEQGKPRVHKITCAIDCGTVINPEIVEQQIESAIAYGLSAALYGEVQVRGGQVTQKNFNDMPMLRIDEMPEVEVVIMASTAAPEGVGEPGTPPVAPAVANALFNLTGKRLRSLPLKLS
jgi:isoquinoline 1-oxidoreductase beta subunit